MADNASQRASTGRVCPSDCRARAKSIGYAANSYQHLRTHCGRRCPAGGTRPRRNRHPNSCKRCRPAFRPSRSRKTMWSSAQMASHVPSRGSCGRCLDGRRWRKSVTRQVTPLASGAEQIEDVIHCGWRAPNFPPGPKLSPAGFWSFWDQVANVDGARPAGSTEPDAPTPRPSDCSESARSPVDGSPAPPPSTSQITAPKASESVNQATSPSATIFWVRLSEVGDADRRHFERHFHVPTSSTTARPATGVSKISPATLLAPSYFVLSGSREEISCSRT